MNANQQFYSHPVFQIIEQIRTRLNANDATQIIIHDRDFIISVIEYFEARINVAVYLKNFDPIINPTLNNVQNLFQQTLNEINNFLANKNYGYINNAKNSLITAVSYINSLPFLIPENENFTKIIGDFKNLVSNDLKEVENKLNGIKTEINNFTEQVSQIKNRFNEQQTQINNLSTNFTNEFNQLKSSFSKEMEDEKKKAIEQGNKLINELTSKLEDAKKIVNIIGNYGVTGNYQQTAEYHRKQANKWRHITVILMIVAVVYLACNVSKIGNYDWHISLLRILSTLIFIYPAQYAANQSKIHREQEIFNKKMELDLAAIGPFIELLDEKKKQEIKEKLVEKYFSPTTINDKSEINIPLPIYERIINQIINLLSQLKIK